MNLRYKALRLFAEMKSAIERDSTDKVLNGLLAQSCTLKAIGLLKGEQWPMLEVIGWDYNGGKERLAIYKRIAELSEMEEIIKSL